MKYNKFLTILFASGLLCIAVACTDNFEADNRNNTGFDSELQEYDFQKYLLKFEKINAKKFESLMKGEISEDILKDNADTETESE